MTNNDVSILRVKIGDVDRDQILRFERFPRLARVEPVDLSLEYMSEETGDEVVLMKDRSTGCCEKLNFSAPESDSVHVALETTPA